LPPDGAEHPFAPYVRVLGRGPGRSRALSREEAREALGMILRGEADPHQTGAFLMLLRYRGEDADGMAGLVEAARAHLAHAPEPIGADLDWPSYGAGRTRGAPWFLLSALALGQAGHRVLMHGSNAHSQGLAVSDALRMVGQRPAESRADAARLLRDTGFAYLPLASLSPALERLLGLRALLGLRSPVNTVARLLNPFDAGASVDGVFHPPYIDLHLGAAERLGRARLLVVKPGSLEDRQIADLPGLLEPGDCLVVNDSKVIAAPLTGRRIWRGAREPQIETTQQPRIDGPQRPSAILAP